MRTDNSSKISAIMWTVWLKKKPNCYQTYYNCKYQLANKVFFSLEEKQQKNALSTSIKSFIIESNFSLIMGWATIFLYYNSQMYIKYTYLLTFFILLAKMVNFNWIDISEK